jgi:hypothetical protein
MKGNTIILVVLAVVAFLFLRNSSTNTTTTTSKTVGLTPSTDYTVSSIINGLFSIFSDNSSSLNQAPEGEAYIG